MHLVRVHRLGVPQDTRVDHLDDFLAFTRVILRR